MSIEKCLHAAREIAAYKLSLTHTHARTHALTHARTHTHARAHIGFPCFMGTFQIDVMVFILYNLCFYPLPLNLPLSQNVLHS